jgi:hypothetical protein
VWWISASEMDITSGRRSITLDDDYVAPVKTWKNMPIRAIRALF